MLTSSGRSGDVVRVEHTAETAEDRMSLIEVHSAPEALTERTSSLFAPRLWP
jgi:hypothetical protein